MSPTSSKIIVFMGVSGSGKSTVAARFARRIDCPMLEGDSLHDPANVERMSNGIPLDDAQRQGWLERIAARIRAAKSAGEPLVVTCSALKHSYRDLLRHADPDLLFVYLAGSRAALMERLRARRGHFMPPSLLDSQLQTLEEPAPDEHSMQFSISMEPQAVVDKLVRALGGGVVQATE